MESIWKFQLATTDTQHLFIPEGAELLCVQTQYDVPCIWAKVDTDAEDKDVLVTIRGTGHPVSTQDKYLGTFQLSGGNFIGHVFYRWTK